MIDRTMSVRRAMGLFAFAGLVVTAPAIGAPVAPLGVGGEGAVREFAGRLPEIAARYGMAPGQLAMLLKTDGSVRLDADGRIFYVCVRGADGAIPGGGGAGLRSTIPLSDAFVLNSTPGASKTIYLDFDGHHSVNNSWGHNIVFPPFDRSGNSAVFETYELEEVIGTWEQVVEDFAPFNVNVTTQDPGVAALSRSGGGDTTYGVRCVMTQATGGFGDGIGGVAFLNSFDDSIDNPVFAFNKGILNGGMTASHEVGHALGLSHDGLDGSAYHPGAGNASNKTSWGPIMGAPFGRNLVQWSNGDYEGSTTTQDDVAIITNGANGITTLGDDHGNTLGSATAVVLGATVAGLIERRTDVDVFSFDAPCGEVTILAAPRDPGPNVDLLLEIFDESGALIASDNHLREVFGEVTVELEPGLYYVRLDGAAHENGRYSDYGCLGAYTLTVTQSGACPCPADIDGNGTLNLDDVDAFVAAFSGSDLAADCDGSGALNLDDVDCFVASYLGGCP